MILIILHHNTFNIMTQKLYSFDLSLNAEYNFLKPAKKYYILTSFKNLSRTAMFGVVLTQNSICKYGSIHFMTLYPFRLGKKKLN